MSTLNRFVCMALSFGALDEAHLQAIAYERLGETTQCRTPANGKPKLLLTLSFKLGRCRCDRSCIAVLKGQNDTKAG